MWRPRNWENPFYCKASANFGHGLAFWNEHPEIYEAGADAMLRALVALARDPRGWTEYRRILSRDGDDPIGYEKED